ncbi:HD domain-containing protein [Iocasia frigidifontis]|uniref:HD domain-containing protein n=1 Tax=Iocasia fonsfrigidae TaxID=2682810 RepID=A0A8A7K6Z8_9FIRM|nr:HD domain-containing phosphohydrolase [Iocasia fonsfrigidae]QTL97171.1 HD domain-containing protein [Iocasia fonsfrigidae]
MENKEYSISLYKILKSFSSAMDLISTEVVGHHKKVAYICYVLGLELGLKPLELKDLIFAALIHDIGVFYLDQNFSDLAFDSRSNLHAEVGYQLSRDYFPSKRVAKIIKYHHVEWSEQGQLDEGDILYISSILFLADRICTLLNGNDGREILNRVSFIVEKINSLAGQRFYPPAVEAFNKVADREYFWLDLTSNQEITRKFDSLELINQEYIDLDILLDISQLISYIIDFRSPFTATHSMGVAAVSEKLAADTGYGGSECKMMRIAGYLHDIGKLAVPLAILNKPGKLKKDEWQIMKTHTYYTYRVLAQAEELSVIRDWAAFHHETLKGDGYPFHLKAGQLSRGSRIMSVADVFTALTEDRPYRDSMSKEKVLEILAEMLSNQKLDQDIVAIVRDSYSEYSSIRLQAQLKAIKHYNEFKQRINKSL